MKFINVMSECNESLDDILHYIFINIKRYIIKVSGEYSSVSRVRCRVAVVVRCKVNFVHL